jgi:deazaflavin-dependent oxidoreductase (nitroreductase family)
MSASAASDAESGLDGEYVPSPSEASGGVDGATLEGRPVVILASVAATSGKVRKNPVMRIVDGDRYVAVASAGGSPKDRPGTPIWLPTHGSGYQDGASVKEFRAREVTGDEKRHYWVIAARFWPHFPEYRQLAAGRDIPIMVLEPVTPHRAGAATGTQA